MARPKRNSNVLETVRLWLSGLKFINLKPNLLLRSETLHVEVTQAF
jgi:hypothetical protein